MLYPSDFESKVGFTAIRSYLVEKCSSRPSKEKAHAMSFSNDRKEIGKKLRSVHEMKRLITSGLSMPQDNINDIVPALKQHSSPGAFLPAETLYETGVTFHSMNEINKFFNIEDIKTQFPELSKLFCEMPSFSEMENKIFRCIEKTGEIKDNASPELFEIRSKMNSVSRSMHSIMRRVMENSVKNGLIESDATPAMRDGHLVIPVSSAKKRELIGIVHDTSSTGKTVFIEPAEVVEAGNRLTELQAEEQREIINILTSLTQELHPFIEEIIEGCDLLAEYDFIKSKALFAIETYGEMPVLEPKIEIDWFHAVHPGLYLSLKKQGREVVPLNLNLNEDKRILVISGPNAGGKSVALKTVGTVQYMMQCGLLPTLHSNSHMGIFSDIFIDIGDEQSMENDLSTYSSHLANMKFFLKNANHETLLLADEMGSGTEPQIGAALAQSILQKLGETGCFGVITTHYSNLKVFAESEKGFINGAMLYDRQHFRPTFQLSVGHPGSSFALEIARNIGLPLSVIDKAKEIVGSDYVNSEKFLLDIQRDRRYWQNKRQDIKEKEHKLDKLLEEYELTSSDLKAQRSSIIREAKQEAKEILAGANSQIERSIHEIRKAQAEKEQSKQIRKELEEYKKTLDIEEKDLNLPSSIKTLRHKSKKKKKEAGENSKQKTSLSDAKFEIGDFVKMSSGGITGKIISLDGNKAEVAFGNLRTFIEISKLTGASKPKESVKETSFSISAGRDNSSRERQLNFKTDIDVRGMRAEEALQAITYFLDDALQFSAGRVRILHGTGHGILRTLIREQLRSNKSVKDFHDEDVRFGGAGITVVDMN